MVETTVPKGQTDSSAAARRDKVKGFEAPESDQSAELLRLALPMISRHGRGFAPVSYAIWYEYVRGANRALRDEIDDLLQNNERLSADVTFDVYKRHIVGQFEEAVLNGRANLLEMLDGINQTVEETQNSTGNFDSKISGLSEELDQGLEPDQIKARLTTFRSELTNMNDSVATLNNQLITSRNEVERLADELAKAKEEAQIDPLTGLLNRRTFDHNMNTSINAAAGGEPDAEKLTLLMVDIDHFKAINDEHGHLFGDKVIQGISKILNNGVMRKDSVSRYGGEEFALILPATDAVGGIAVAQRIRETVARSRIRRANSDKVLSNITVSIGLAQFRHGDTPETLIERADSALYRAKETGRNRVVDFDS